DPAESQDHDAAVSKNEKTEPKIIDSAVTTDELNQLIKEKREQFDRLQEVGVACKKNKPYALSPSVWDNLDQEQKSIKSEIKQFKQISGEMEQHIKQLEVPRQEPLVIIGTGVKSDEWEKFCAEAKEVWKNACEEQNKKYLESPEYKAV